MNEEEKLLCPYCSKPFTKEMMEVYEGTYGCETGCSTVEVVVDCKNCGKEIYSKSELGSVYEETSDEEWQKIIDKYNSKLSIKKNENNMNEEIPQFKGTNEALNNLSIK